MILSEKDLKETLNTFYKLDTEVKKIAGYEEQNFLLNTNTGLKLICKVNPAPYDEHYLDAQLKALQFLSATPLAAKVQSVLANLQGQAITKTEINGHLYCIRVLSFLEGTFLAELPVLTPELLTDLGSTLAKMDQELKTFNHPAVYRFNEWDLAYVLASKENLHFIKDHEKRRIAAYFLLQYEMEVVPLMYQLRTAVVHNDAHDLNVLADQDKVTGFIDFGDIAKTQLIHNIAITLTYVMFRQEQPLQAAVTVLKAYHQGYNLTEQELSVLYYLIGARLSLSVTQSASKRAQGDNEHHFVSENDAWKLLYQLLKINPVLAQNEFNLACGFPKVSPAKEELDHLLKIRKERIGANLSISYKKPLKIIKGAFQYLYDDQGDTFIDCVNNVSHVGHCHPVVVRAMQQQAAKLNTNTRYLHDSLLEYAKLITDSLPDPLSVCYFTNSGSEANDLAIRISRHYTRQKDVIVLDHAYHGTSTVAMELSPYKFDGPGGGGQPSHIHKAMNPDLYRGAYRYGDPQAGAKYALDVERLITALKTSDKGIAAFICETLLGVGGQIPLPPDYLKEVYRHVRAAGGLCIADEVQVGFGRIGDHFWGFELQNVVPDIVVLGKPIGNGHPMAAVVVTAEIAASFNNGMEYFNTFGGNPVSMETGIAVMKVIREEELQLQALETGNHLMVGLTKLMDKHPLIGEVRGHGLFVGVELVRDFHTLEPAVPEIDLIVEEMRNRGFLLSTDGPLHNVIKIKPPLVFSKENADDLVAHLDEVLYKIK